MNAQELQRMLERIGAVYRGHFVGTGNKGRHMTTYVDSDVLHRHEAELGTACLKIANTFLFESIDIVVGPNNTLVQGVARYFPDVRTFLTQKVPEGFSLDRPLLGSVFKKARVLVVEDMITSGASVKKVIDLVNSLHPHRVHVAALWNRGGVPRESLGHDGRLVSLIDTILPSWTPEECAEKGPCSEGVPVNTEVGHGQKFLQSLVEK